jgi:hypothetical protein
MSVKKFCELSIGDIFFFDDDFEIAKANNITLSVYCKSENYTYCNVYGKEFSIWGKKENLTDPRIRKVVYIDESVADFLNFLTNL